MCEEGFTITFQHAFKLSLGCDEVAKEMKNKFTATHKMVLNRCFITERVGDHLLSPVSAECGQIKKENDTLLQFNPLMKI